MSRPATHSVNPGGYGAWTDCNRYLAPNVATVLASELPSCPRCRRTVEARRSVAIGQLIHLEAVRTNGNPGPAIEREIERLRERAGVAK